MEKVIKRCEIDFRAFADGKMHYPTDEMWWYFSSTGYWSLNRGDGPGEIICDSLESKDAVLMEFTGLKDVLGEKIYNGDICKFIIGYLDYDSLECTEIFNDNIPERVFIQEIKIDSWAGIINTLKIEVDLHEPIQIERIGNIYENPGLLEG